MGFGRDGLAILDEDEGKHCELDAGVGTPGGIEVDVG